MRNIAHPDSGKSNGRNYGNRAVFTAVGGKLPINKPPVQKRGLKTANVVRRNLISRQKKTDGDISIFQKQQEPIFGV